MIKTLLCAFALYFISLTGFTQTLYDVQWTHDGNPYNAIMVFFNENDIHMRIGYADTEGYNVQHAEYEYTVDEEFGEFVFLEALSTDLIQDEGVLIPEETFHFIWVMDEDGEMMGPYVVTEYEIENDLYDELVEVTLEEMSADHLY